MDQILDLVVRQASQQALLEGGIEAVENLLLVIKNNTVASPTSYIVVLGKSWGFTETSDGISLAALLTTLMPEFTVIYRHKHGPDHLPVFCFVATDKHYSTNEVVLKIYIEDHIREWQEEIVSETT